MKDLINTILRFPGATILRVGLSLVFLWFGIQQFLSPDMWIGFIPQWVIDMSPFGPVTLVHINGAIEVVFGTALITGLFTRASALILALHMAHITILVGYDSIGVRDFGLAIAGFAIFFNGADRYTLDYIFMLKKDDQPVDQSNPDEPSKPFKYVPGQFHV